MFSAISSSFQNGLNLTKIMYGSRVMINFVPKFWENLGVNKMAQNGPKWAQKWPKRYEICIFCIFELQAIITWLFSVKYRSNGNSTEEFSINVKNMTPLNHKLPIFEPIFFRSGKFFMKNCFNFLQNYRQETLMSSDVCYWKSVKSGNNL